MLKSLKTKLVKHLDSKYSNWDITIAMRYLPIVEHILVKFPKHARILEVGPGELGILPYLDPEYKITGLDVDFGNRSQSGRMRMVKHTGNRLPFPDDSFDLVVSMDTLEHVPTTSRNFLIAESLRVAKKQVIFGFPTGYFAQLADGYLSWFYRLTHKADFPYLSEHRRYGLPDSLQVKKQFVYSAKSLHKKITISSLSNTNVVIWMGLLTLGFSEFKPLTFIYRLLSMLLPVFRYLNFPPSYRQIIFVNANNGKN